MSPQRDPHEASDWVERICAALEQDRFVLYQQPLLELCSGAVARHEILLRMVAEDGEHIAPMAFLPTAEQAGLVQAIDAWVIRHAIDLIARQAQRGHALHLDVNISGASVTDPELLAVIERELASAEIDPSCLIFEITETAAIGDIKLAQQFAGRLGELGCGFALDDFGAGFGSFFYLKHIPFDTLKIDGEFIRGLVHCERDQIMVKAIARVARDLGTETVAEFVTDDATRELVRSYGVHYAQGYGIGRPRPITATWPGAFVEPAAVERSAAPPAPPAESVVGQPGARAYSAPAPVRSPHPLRPGGRPAQSTAIALPAAASSSGSTVSCRPRPSAGSGDARRCHAQRPHDDRHRAARIARARPGTGATQRARTERRGQGTRAGEQAEAARFSPRQGACATRDPARRA